MSANLRWELISSTAVRGEVELTTNSGWTVAVVGTPISVDEYLHTLYRPDCDYVDGEIVERNIGEKSHGKLQVEIWFFLDRKSVV